METVQELIPFAREMLSQKPGRKMVRLYVLGSVLTFFGVLIGLVETVCSPFASQDRLEEEEEEEEEKESSPREQAAPQPQGDSGVEKTKELGAQPRSLVNRQHAS
ncbi:PREDICTED: G0/G1 switch protein 2 [Gavialis gangeticus]|uniref:G0/G1 switch protein 2 n=1 Tax=Gavialis gangeticus TaxID=94835 RepID=UPI00092E2F3E|nr:PREDICTED: G0/G1 switch protein 2 [Gavialis gangeticus]